MQRYYFDLVDADGLFEDEEGMLLQDVEAAEKEAGQAVMCAARSVLADTSAPVRLVVKVRDDLGPVLQVRLAVEMEIERKN